MKDKIHLGAVMMDEEAQVTGENQDGENRGIGAGNTRSFTASAEINSPYPVKAVRQKAGQAEEACDHGCPGQAEIPIHIGAQATQILPNQAYSTVGALGKSFKAGNSHFHALSSFHSTEWTKECG